MKVMEVGLLHSCSAQAQEFYLDFYFVQIVISEMLVPIRGLFLTSSSTPPLSVRGRLMTLFEAGPPGRRWGYH